MPEASVHTYVDRTIRDGKPGVSIMIRNASIIECTDQLVPVCMMTPDQARALAAALMRRAEAAETEASQQA
jgi:polyhydroxyalkanoate synthesis regulator phasin